MFKATNITHGFYCNLNTIVDRIVNLLCTFYSKSIYHENSQQTYIYHIDSIIPYE